MTFKEAQLRNMQRCGEKIQRYRHSLRETLLTDPPEHSIYIQLHVNVTFPSGLVVLTPHVLSDRKQAEHESALHAGTLSTQVLRI